MSTPCVLVKGSDPALVAQAAHDVIGSLLADLDPSTCVEELGGPSVDDFDLGRLVDALTTPPFLVDRRIVVVREAGRLSQADAERLGPLLDDPVEGVTAVFVAGGGSQVPQALQRKVAAVGEVVDTSVGNSAKDRRAFVTARVRKGEVRLDGPAQELLAAHFGEDLSRVDGVLATLAAAYGEGAAVGVEELEPFLGATGSVPEWDLTDAITAGNAATALAVLQRLVGPGGRAAPAIVGSLQRHYVRLLRLDGSGARTKEDAASLLAMSAFPASKLLVASRALGSERIRQAVAWVAQADGDVKGATGLEPEMVLEILVARLARLHRAAGRG